MPPEKSSLDRFAEEKLQALAARQLRRILVESAREDGIHVRRGGRLLVSFSCNDYLNLSQDARVKEAAIEAVRQYGAGAGASRLVTGNHPLYALLEARLAALKGTEAACVFGSGYLANIGIIPALIGKDDLLLIDELSHACLGAGARLTRATVMTFRHNDLGHAEALLREHRPRHPRALLATDGVFSMDGDRAKLPGLAELAARHDAWLLADDAHGLGVLGGGRGSGAAFGGAAGVPLQMGTLSKAVGAYGGYLCASHAVVELIKNRARSFVYSTGLPPAAVGAAIAALDIIANDRDLVEKPLRHAREFTRLAGLPEAQSPIVPIVLGAAARALAAAKLLEDEGYLAIAIRPPTVAEGTARLRLAFTAAHQAADIANLAALIRDRILR
ncbi:MAG TPA: aminotransferase class I/II-fold pyridoxal phosphate-dependent enzyme [Stellaceae bacterium]|nr:aminotransferase class I/II-fold pyridoxal phosphate-dependent enzyme [Stellaceae bacterium]